jgi:hypothetical protein
MRIVQSSSKFFPPPAGLSDQAGGQRGLNPAGTGVGLAFQLRCVIMQRGAGSGSALFGKWRSVDPLF